MDMIQTFKIIQNIDDIPMEGMFEFSNNHTHGHTKKLKKPRALKSSLCSVPIHVELCVIHAEILTIAHVLSTTHVHFSHVF